MRKSVGLLMTGLEGSMTFSDIGGYNKLTGYETEGLVVTYAYTKDSEGHIVGIALEDGTASAQYIFDQDWILQGIVTDDGSTGSVCDMDRAWERNMRRTGLPG